jgi:hypothetical protein
MNPVSFPQANQTFGPPADLEESQCQPIRAFLGKIEGGSCDGSDIVVVAWQPSRYDLELILSGSPIFISMIGGLAPHCVGTSFDEVSSPA